MNQNIMLVGVSIGYGHNHGPFVLRLVLHCKKLAPSRAADEWSRRRWTRLIVEYERRKSKGGRESRGGPEERSHIIFSPPGLEV